MVGIVVVSHSHPLATAAVELAAQMAQGDQGKIAVAAGLDETTLGTDAMRIKAAIEEVDTPDGVLVLMDLGSAVLSAETALELLDPQVRSRVALCPGPLVEGLVVATVTAGGGGSLSEVAAEATAALSGKQSHLTLDAPVAEGPQPAVQVAEGPQPAVPVGPAPVTGVVTLANAHGLHARPAARLVAEVRDLAARVALRNLTTGAGPVSAASLSQVATLGARQGHEVEISAEGGQAREAVDKVLALAARNFDEADADADAPAARAPAPAAPAPAGPPGGPLPASPGVAVGPAWVPEPAGWEVPDVPAADPATEWQRLVDAAAAVRRETGQVRARTAAELGEQEAAIFDAHLLLLDDADLLDRVRRDVNAGHRAETAWHRVVGALEEQMAGLADDYQRARAADVRAVGEQVLRELLGVAGRFESRDGVLIAADLTPAEVSGLDPARVTGIVLGAGSPTAHAAILARTMSIPMLVAAGPDVLAVPEGTVMALDGGSGELVVDPDPDTRDRYAARAAARHRMEAQARAMAAQPATTRDNVAVDVAANLGSVADAEQARSAGADAAGLVRTEFLFLDRAVAPDMAEQERAYRAMAEAMGGRRITLRTLDVGGDKPLPYLPTPAEANPFLGLRGLRLSLTRVDLLRDQLMAACRVARDTPVSLMFPMVSTQDELLAALRVLDTAVAASGGSRPAGLAVGIMVEVPAAALMARSFLPYVDFFSIGTNDLTQYTLAAERGNAAVARLADPLDPAVLQLIDAVCRAAAGQVGVAVCGEAASDEAAVPLLLGLGVRELSVVPSAVPTVKQLVRGIDTGEAAGAARAALAASGADEVRALAPSSPSSPSSGKDT